MYQSFTGSARRPRNVNLSGRPSNPFAAATSGTAASGAQQAVASAQQDRLHRQQQRDRLHASSRIQKVWRGHRARRRTFAAWRQIWDETENRSSGAYRSSQDSLRQLRRLLLFFSPAREQADIQRLAWYGTRHVTTTETVNCEEQAWIPAYAKLQRACITALKARTTPNADTDRTLLWILAFAARHSPFTTNQAIEYYDALTSTSDLPHEPLQAALLAPLQHSEDAYTGLVILLARPVNSETLDLLRAAVDSHALAEAVIALWEHRSSTARERLWLLANMIYVAGQTSSVMFTAALGRLLGSLADHVVFEGNEGHVIDADNESFNKDVLSKLTDNLPLNSFLDTQLKKLIDQDTIRNLLSNNPSTSGSGNDAQVLAGYALTLLRCFPAKSDSIRMWLHRGAISQSGVSPTGFLWDAARQSQVFRDVSSNPRQIVTMLNNTKPSTREQDDWTVLLVFLEMFTFDLKIMDDEEFMGSSSQSKKNSAVPVRQVASLVTFLKNLGFTLYFDAKDLHNTATPPPRYEPSYSANRRFAPTPTQVTSEAKPLTVAGLPGLTIDYLKGVVTGLLRAIYERDSRRNFLPADHWLMTDRFDMKTFIPGVVEEEERRHTVQDMDEQDREDDGDDDDDDDADSSNRMASRGVSNYARVLRSQEKREREQRKASRQRYLESVAPRLEILQNMPFFIPFHTRVEIFRQFVYLDQAKRRNGYVDQEAWRMMMRGMLGEVPGMDRPSPGQRDPLSRHHARIKRDSEFQDAYEQFYDLGAGLKEPIQITFIDQFDQPEAGIDGGGVTKEFLTSVIDQAFEQDPERGQTFFVENDQNLLYPNPTAVEDLRARMQEFGLRRDSPEAREQVRELLKQYQFLGRIIGKCLYEGILVDVSFAGFFLKKWALTGGHGSARNESNYRPNINDLRELDETIYKGLLDLKNADNAEDFGLDFTVNVTVGSEHNSRVVTVDLAPNGSNIPVTNENRIDYINRMATFRLQAQSKPQTNAFLDGLKQIIEPSWLSMFNQTELQTLIGGAQGSTIDVEDLRRNTQYGGTYVIGNDGQEHPSVQRFWNVMHALPDEDRRKVLKFVTSTPRGPLLGFGYLNPKFSIRDSGGDEGRYPTTSTCVNLLKLPMYKDEQVLKRKLLAAVNSGAGFDLS